MCESQLLLHHLLNFALCQNVEERFFICIVVTVVTVVTVGVLFLRHILSPFLKFYNLIISQRYK